MIEFWNRWWALPTALSLLSGVLWAIWTYMSASPIEKPASSVSLSPSEKRWLRWCGWLTGIAGRSLTLRTVPYGQWHALQVEHEGPMRIADKANRARFATPMTFAWAAGLLGMAQAAMTLVCLAAAPGSPWFFVSMVLIAWDLAPLFVTLTLMSRWWARRLLFEWRFLQGADVVVRRLEKDSSQGKGDILHDLDTIEEILADRFARAPLGLPSHAARARRWLARSTPVLETRPLVNRTEDRTLLLGWVERCSAIIRSDWERPRMFERSSASPLAAKPPFPGGAGIRFAWSVTVMFVNTILIGVLVVAHNIAPRMQAITEVLTSPALVTSITIVAISAQGVTFLVRMITRWISS